MAAIEIENLSKWYGEVIGFSNVTATIEPGVTGLLGANGAGKTTLMHVLSGLLKADTGRATIGGQRVWDNPRLYQLVGYCPDDERFYERLTGLQFLEYMARLRGKSKRDGRKAAGELLERVGLAHAAHKRIGAYSKGMRQRVKFAQAIIHSPEVLFLDEPLSGMDPESRIATVGLIRDYGDQGKTVVVSSHILQEVEDMTHRILVLNNGLLLAEGDVLEIRELIEEQPRQVRILTSDRQKLSAFLIQCPEVQTIRFGDQNEELIVLVKSPDDFFARAGGYVLDHGIAIHQMNTLDENLQSVFEYLVKPI